MASLDPVADVFEGIRILIADDHALLRDGVSLLIQQHPDMKVVGEASDGHQAVDAYRRFRPDVTLLDLQMPEMDGLAALVGIRRICPDARIIVLTTYAGDAQVVRAMHAGAAGYLLKSGLRHELIKTIRIVHAGKKYVDQEVASAVITASPADMLSPREVEVLKLVSVGTGNREISVQLGLSEETIKSHMRTILAKLQASDRTHAVTIALRRGILTL